MREQVSPRVTGYRKTGGYLVRACNRAWFKVTLAADNLSPSDCTRGRAGWQPYPRTSRIESGQTWERDAYRLLEDLLGQAFAIPRKDIPLGEDGRLNLYPEG